MERGGQARVTHVADVSARTLRKAIAKHVNRKSTMNTDDALAYYHMSKEFADSRRRQSQPRRIRQQGRHRAHPVCGGVLRYLDEFAFRWSNRSALGVEDTRGRNIEGHRLVSA